MCVSERYLNMAINPYTLNNLYNYGILDYAPYELCNGGVNVSSMNGMQNPYLSNAMQGTLFQQYGSQADSFTMNNGNPFTMESICLLYTSPSREKHIKWNDGYGFIY